MLGSKREGPGESERAAQSPAFASASRVLYTVAKLIVGKAGRRRSKSSCAVGCVGSAASSRTIAIRCGVSLRPEARTQASIDVARLSPAIRTEAGLEADERGLWGMGIVRER